MKVLLIALLLVVVVNAVKKEKTGHGISGGHGSESHGHHHAECKFANRLKLNNFLHTEKGRQFAALLANADWLRPGQVRGWRLLPSFYENEQNHAFSQFFLIDGNFTALEAQNACQKFDGASLASFHTQNRWEYINKLMVAGNYWFGLQRFDKDSDFVWSNGQSLGDTHWDENQPKSAGTQFDCVRTMNPPSLTCNATACFADEFAPWTTEKCTTSGYPALCEVAYPRPLYTLITGKFNQKEAQSACKNQFKQFKGVNLAMPKTKSEFENLFYGVNMYYKKWNCWTGLERSDAESSKRQWVDGSAVTPHCHVPELDSNWSDKQRCGSLYDSAYSASKGLDANYYDYNDCHTQLDCAICQWHWPL